MMMALDGACIPRAQAVEASTPCKLVVAELAVNRREMLQGGWRLEFGGRGVPGVATFI